MWWEGVKKRQFLDDIVYGWSYSYFAKLYCDHSDLRLTKNLEKNSFYQRKKKFPILKSKKKFLNNSTLGSRTFLITF